MAIKVYIDQGHNPSGANAGAEGNGYREQDLVYTIGRLTAEELTSRGFDVRLSRPSADTQLGTSNATSLFARTSDANSWGADVFISLHANASDNQSASGSEAFVYSMSSPAVSLAENILFALNVSTGLRNRGVTARPNLYVLRRSAMPATLVELGFITNRVDADLMANQPALFSRGVANGVSAYFGML